MHQDLWFTYMYGAGRTRYSLHIVPTLERGGLMFILLAPCPTVVLMASLLFMAASSSRDGGDLGVVVGGLLLVRTQIVSNLSSCVQTKTPYQSFRIALSPIALIAGVANCLLDQNNPNSPYYDVRAEPSSRVWRF